MMMIFEDRHYNTLDDTRPARPVVSPASDHVNGKEHSERRVPVNVPWILQQFIEGQLSDLELDGELVRRFPSMPVMSTASFRRVGLDERYGAATLATQDNAALLLVDVDRATRVVQFSFTMRSMLTLRYTLSGLTEMERARWLETLRLKDTRLAFLWGRQRWESNYLVCVAHKYHTNLYAFSPQHFESAARLTPDVTRRLLDWLDGFWKSDAREIGQQLHTW
jgi:hypothetical protein